MSVRTAATLRATRGHTLIELMVAIIIGLILVLAAFTVMATFEGNKRTTTAMNDALQSGNIGMYEIDKLIRAAGTGLSQYGLSVGSNGPITGYGCPLNYTSGGGTAVTGGAVSLPAPFSSTLSTTLPERLVPVVIFPGATTVTGSFSSTGSPPAASDALLLMLAGGGYAEVPIRITAASGPQLDSTVGFSANEWVLLGKADGSACGITNVSSTYTTSATNVVLPLAATTIGGYTMAVNDYVVPLGQSAATNFVMYAVDSADNSLKTLDLLNSVLDSTAVYKVSDDVMLMRAVYGVDPDNTGTLTWTSPVSGVTVSGGNTYDYSPSGLLSGSGAGKALTGIKAIRVGMIVRAPLNEKAGTANLGTSLDLFSSLPTALHLTWTFPTGTSTNPQNYRYREIETTIPIRNNGLL